MKMTSITIDEFIALLPKKLREVAGITLKPNNIPEIYVHIPRNIHEKNSSFTIMVLLDLEKQEVFSSSTICDRNVDEYSVEDGMKIAAHRLFREYMNMTSLYGREQPVPVQQKDPTDFMFRFSGFTPISLPQRSPQPKFIKRLNKRQMKLINQFVGFKDVTKFGKGKTHEAIKNTD
jgi:hypothetical protein